MREIKFRAWIYAYGMNYGMVYYYQDKDLCEYFGFNNKKIPTMQYTGVKDKKGKEIYEGDIISSFDFAYERTGGRSENREIIGKVVFRHCAWYFVEIKTNYAYDLYSLYMEDMEIEVIGNIHENPELLEGKNEDNK